MQGKSLPANRKMKQNHDDLSINVNKVETILLAFQIWEANYSGQWLRIFTDSTTAHSRLSKFTLKGPPNALLQEIWLLAAKWNIIIDAYKIEEKENGLANALSRFDEQKVINLSLH